MNYKIFNCYAESDAEYLVLSSGLGGHGSFWQPQIESLRQYFHVLTYDQEGCHAGAPILDRAYSMQDMALQLFDILQEIKLEKFHFIGHALGGFIGAELLRLMRYSDLQMQSLTVINGWKNLDPHTLKCFQTRISLLKHSGETAYVEAQALFLYPPTWISTHIESIQQAEQTQLNNFPPKQNVLLRLKALMQYQISEETQMLMRKIPLHLIANQDDFLVPYHQTEQLQQLFPHAKMSLFAHGGHASTVTQPETINAYLIDFTQTQHTFSYAS